MRSKDFRDRLLHTRPSASMAATKSKRSGWPVTASTRLRGALLRDTHFGVTPRHTEAKRLPCNQSALSLRSCSSTMSTNMIRLAVLRTATKTWVTQGEYEDHCLGLGQQSHPFEVEESDSLKKRSLSEFLQPITPGMQNPCFSSSLKFVVSSYYLVANDPVRRNNRRVDGASLESSRC